MQANKFADKCFTSLELYSLKDNFKSLADVEHGVRYLKEDTVARFLEIPDILGASPVVFQMVSYIGAFPFLQDAPAVLGLEQLVVVITLMTERYKRVLARGSADRRRLLFRSLAVYDRKLSETGDNSAPDSREGGRASAARSHAPGFAVDAAGEDDDDDDGGGDDGLVLAAFESLDYVDAFRHDSATTAATTVSSAVIPADNFRKLLMLLLLVAPAGPPGAAVAERGPHGRLRARQPAEHGRRTSWPPSSTSRRRPASGTSASTP